MLKLWTQNVLQLIKNLCEAVATDDDDVKCKRPTKDFKKDRQTDKQTIRPTKDGLAYLIWKLISLAVRCEQTTFFNSQLRIKRVKKLLQHRRTLAIIFFLSPSLDFGWWWVVQIRLRCKKKNVARKSYKKKHRWLFKDVRYHQIEIADNCSLDNFVRKFNTILNTPFSWNTNESWKFEQNMVSVYLY